MPRRQVLLRRVRITVAGVALLLVAASCTSEQQARTTTHAPITTTTTQPPIPSTTTTTTLPYQRVDAVIEGDDEVSDLVAAFYTWASDRDAPRPDMADGLVAHLAAPITVDGPVVGTVHTDGVIDMGAAGVAVIDNGDVLILVNDFDRTGETFEGWRIVGAWLDGSGVGPWFGNQIRHVLAIGTDAREWQDPPRFRGDSLHIISSNLDLRGGGILGFPRDSWVEAPYGTDKFTHINALVWTAIYDRIEKDLETMGFDPSLSDLSRTGTEAPIIEYLAEGPDGGEVTVQVAEELTGLDIEGYILTGFRDFQLLINDYGSVTVDVPFAMADRASGAFFQAGVQELWGKAALAFSRNRHLRGGDLTRSFHQGVVILGRLAGVQDTGWESLPWLVSALVAHTWTDLSLEQLMTLGATALVLDPDMIGNEVAPGSVTTRGGASVVVLSDSAEELYRDLDDGVLGNEPADEDQEVEATDS